MPGVDKSLQRFNIMLNAKKIIIREIFRGYLKDVRVNKTEKGQNF